MGYRVLQGKIILDDVDDLIPCFEKLGLRSAWVSLPFYHLSLYARITRRLLGDDAQDSIDVATVDIDPGHRSKGNLRRFLTRIEHVADEVNRFVYVECVNNKRLLKHLTTKRGYVQAIRSDPYSVWRDTRATG